MWSREQARAVGVRVRHARAAAGISQSELARRIAEIGVRRRQGELSRLERGLASETEYTSAALLGAIARVTGCDERWLITGEGQARCCSGLRASVPSGP
jgi:transcriptional regulator with XRE-family HTH domain